ncbi:hypothetical protein X798_03463 [Onchocerca flexuosa]|uniref:Uncharacterized protein n=2 Tax=Onchocerca flexuosa TaxID=387005 RepID=A0A183HKZ5_9BILA|nr:hypothetical protein X798_03463 [Onchocerca flexuosa]VDO54282.1 unnamed protein product [Onchocerca flexuosa]
MQSYQAVIMIIIMTLLPLIFLAPMIIRDFLERKQQKMFQFLLEFRPKKFVFSQSSVSENSQFKKEKQLSQNVSRNREEIRAILSVRNHLSPREMLSMLCTSSTQQSSFCTARRNGERMMRSYQKSDKTDWNNISKMNLSSVSSSGSANTAKKQSTATVKFETSPLNRRINSEKITDLRTSSSLSSTAKSFTGQ